MLQLSIVAGLLAFIAFRAIWPSRFDAVTLGAAALAVLTLLLPYIKSFSVTKDGVGLETFLEEPTPQDLAADQAEEDALSSMEDLGSSIQLARSDYEDRVISELRRFGLTDIVRNKKLRGTRGRPLVVDGAGMLGETYYLVEAVSAGSPSTVVSRAQSMVARLAATPREDLGGSDVRILVVSPVATAELKPLSRDLEGVVEFAFLGQGAEGLLWP